MRGCWDITFPVIIMSSFFLERYWKTTGSPFKALTFRLVSRSSNNVCVCDNCRKLVFRFNFFRLFFKLDSVVKQPQNTLVISLIYDFDEKSSLFLKKIAKYSRYSRKNRDFLHRVKSKRGFYFRLLQYLKITIALILGYCIIVKYDTGKFYLQKECALDASITARH